MTIEEKYDNFAWKFVDYCKERDFYDFRDCYQTDQIAHDDILRALKSNKGVNMAMQEIAGDIEDYSFYIQDNKTDKDLKKFLDVAYRLHRELKIFKNELHDIEKKKGVER